MKSYEREMYVRDVSKEIIRIRCQLRKKPDANPLRAEGREDERELASGLEQRRRFLRNDAKHKLAQIGGGFRAGRTT